MRTTEGHADRPGGPGAEEEHVESRLAALIDHRLEALLPRIADLVAREASAAAIAALTPLQHDVDLLGQRMDHALTRLGTDIAEAVDEAAGERQTVREVLDRLEAITTVADGSSLPTSGAELDVAVREAETAAQRILDAADRIAAQLGAFGESGNPLLQQAAEAIAADVATIYDASVAQDLGGQRVRAAIAALEEMRAQLARAVGAQAQDVVDRMPAAPLLGQADIDALFG